MPKCKNDPERSYNGDEPSPKGLGYCAHAEKNSTTKTGKDGNKWIIKTLESGTKRWIKVNKKLQHDCSNFVIYKKTIKNQYPIILPGLLIDNQFYLWKSYNNFEKKPSKLPRNIIKKRLTKAEIKKYCGSEKNVDKTNHHPGFKLYFVSFAGSWDIPFIIYIGKEKDSHIAYIYKINKKNKDTYSLEDYGRSEKTTLIKWRKTIKERYTELVGKYHFINKFITDHTILLQLNKTKYLFIWADITEFEIEDTIKEFYADVPGSYASPLAFSDKYLYFMSGGPIIKIPIKYFTHLKTKTEKEHAYEYVYGHRGNESLEKNGKKIKQKKISNP